MAAKIIENVCTTFSAQAQGFITGEIGPVLWYLFKHSTIDSLRITAISVRWNIFWVSLSGYLNTSFGHFHVVQWVKDPASLPLQWLRPLLWCGFNPWPGNSTCHGHGQENKNKTHYHQQKNKWEQLFDFILKEIQNGGWKSLGFVRKFQ